jgi:Na+/phosphate symporter
MKGNIMNGDQLGGIIRTIGAAAAGYVAAGGVVDANTWTNIVGAVATLAVAAWSIYTNQSSRLATKPTVAPK